LQCPIATSDNAVFEMHLTSPSTSTHTDTLDSSESSRRLHMSQCPNSR
jgi:hypothetical protein